MQKSAAQVKNYDRYSEPGKQGKKAYVLTRFLKRVKT